MKEEVNAAQIENLKESFFDYKNDVNDRLKTIEHWQKFEIVVLIITLITTVITI